MYMGIPVPLLLVNGYVLSRHLSEEVCRITNHASGL